MQCHHAKLLQLQTEVGKHIGIIHHPKFHLGPIISDATENHPIRPRQIRPATLIPGRKQQWDATQPRLHPSQRHRFQPQGLLHRLQRQATLLPQNRGRDLGQGRGEDGEQGRDDGVWAGGWRGEADEGGERRAEVGNGGEGQILVAELLGHGADDGAEVLVLVAGGVLVAEQQGAANVSGIIAG